MIHQELFSFKYNVLLFHKKEHFLKVQSKSNRKLKPFPFWCRADICASYFYVFYEILCTFLFISEKEKEVSRKGCWLVESQSENFSASLLRPLLNTRLIFCGFLWGLFAKGGTAFIQKGLLCYYAILCIDVVQWLNKYYVIPFLNSL